MPLNLFELRNYQIQPAMRDHFIDYFENHFLFSQQDMGMTVLGQFRVIGNPDRFVWLRGFADMTTRLAGLQGFYGGPIWKKYRERANVMILDSDRAHLLRPIGSTSDFTGGRTANTVTAELADGTISPDTGVVSIDFYQTDPKMSDNAAVHLAESYSTAGIQVRVIFVAELAENNFPSLPAIQNPGELLVVSVYEHEAHYYQRCLPSITGDIQWKAQESLLLAPTLRSPLRW